MKRVAILGSTGSIGRQALDVISRHRDRFQVVGLAAGRNAELLREQAEKFEVGVMSLKDDGGTRGLMRVATESGADVVLAATDGAVAFDAVFAAVARGIDVAVANKELIVAAGELLLREAAQSGSHILPVDSEHSALFQCLVGEPKERIARLVLTASGGPFWDKTAQDMENVTVEDALAHPTWRMGTKNTIDSATLMNKGLEVIEASRLFEMPWDRIDVLVHRTSVAHGLAIFTDGAVKAQLCPPDMRVPIGYALAYPDRLEDTSLWPDARNVDALTALGAREEEDAIALRFERPDQDRFPCLRLAYRALERGGTAPAALSAANEIAVQAFVEGRIGFTRIPEVVESVLEDVAPEELSLDSVRGADARARHLAEGLVRELGVVAR
ncbi:MAG TPA: 1-deoxy-D-xylulose-5-phosphate reductoisomerase [Candidatus Baltobacteraceae bacterium]